MMGKRPGEVTQVGGMLGEGVIMDGTLTFNQTFRVDGEFKGKILRSDRLVVGEKGKVSGELEVNSLVIYGRVEGKALVKGAVEIHPKGRLVGELEMTSALLTVMDGGFVEGTLKLATARAVEPPADKKPVQAGGGT
jgi:cytoskeletal protein CcmA (bactofilin family)